LTKKNKVVKMEEYEVESIARYEAEQVVEDVKEELKELEGRIEDTEMRVEGIDRELYDTKSEVIKKLESASHSLQFCEDVGDVCETLIELLNDLVKILKERM